MLSQRTISNTVPVGTRSIVSEPTNGLPTIPPPRIPQATYPIPWCRLHYIIRDVTRQIILLEQSLTNQGFDKDSSAIYDVIHRFNSWAYEHEVYSYPRDLELRPSTYTQCTVRDLVIALRGMIAT